MNNSWARLRAIASDSLSTLHELLEDPTSDERRLIAGYIESKRALAAAFEALAVQKYADPTAMRSAKEAIEAEMNRRYRGVPAKYLRVRGYGAAHTRLLAYLTERVGMEVSSDELRLLTGDAVHTERRARELRDLGFTLDAAHMAGSDVYVLKSSEPDVATAAAYLVAKNVRADANLSEGDEAELLSANGLG